MRARSMERDPRHSSLVPYRDVIIIRISKHVISIAIGDSRHRSLSGYLHRRTRNTRYEMLNIAVHIIAKRLKKTKPFTIVLFICLFTYPCLDAQYTTKRFIVRMNFRNVPRKMESWRREKKTGVSFASYVRTARMRIEGCCGPFSRDKRRNEVGASAKSTRVRS